MSACEGCKAAMTARSRCVCIKLTECDKLQYVKSLFFKLKGSNYKNYVRQPILIEKKELARERR